MNDDKFHAGDDSVWSADWDSLAVAIIRQAYRDYHDYEFKHVCIDCGQKNYEPLKRPWRACPRCGSRNIQQSVVYPYREDVVVFLKSNWFATLCDLLGIDSESVAANIKSNHRKVGCCNAFSTP